MIMDNMDTVKNDPSNLTEERDSVVKALKDSLVKANESVQINEAEVKKLKRELSTAQRKVNRICDGSANRLLCAITNDKIPLDENDEGFLSACSLFANSSFDPSLTEEEIEKMNSDAGHPDTDKDVFKSIREKVNFSDAEQSDRFGRTQNKVVELLKITAKSRRDSLSRSPASKRRMGEKEEILQPSKVANDRPSPKTDSVRKSRLPSSSSKK